MSSVAVLYRRVQTTRRANNQLARLFRMWNVHQGRRIR
jgi:hypothetical protein